MLKMALPLSCIIRLCNIVVETLGFVDSGKFFVVLLDVIGTVIKANAVMTA